MKITFYGHACFMLDTGTTRLLTDPYLTGNALAAVSAKNISADYILISHGHGDHVGDAASIAKRNGAVIITPVETYSYIFGKSGLPSISCNIGGTVNAGNASVQLVSAVHGSGVPGGLACGFIIKAGQKTVYFAGDTALTADMALLKSKHIDAALLPIGDVYTMGPEEAAGAAEMLGAKTVIPMHFNTFPAIMQDASCFAQLVEEKGLACTVLRPGDSTEI